MSIVILSLIETVGLGILGLIIFTMFLLIPAEGVHIEKEFRLGEEGFCIRVEKVKEKNKENK